MLKGLSQILRQPFYLWLMGVYPIFHLYSLNLGLIVDHEVLISLAAMLVASTIAFLLINVFVRNRHKSAFMLVIASICFSISGHLYTQLFVGKSLFVWTLMISVLALLIIGFIYRTKKRKFFVAATFPLNLVALTLLVSPSITIVSGHIYLSSFAQISAANVSTSAIQEGAPKVNDSATHPDIYYIIPDSYPSDAWLKEAMDFDNSDFTQALRDRGFIVADRAQSNYGATFTSLASTLNMRYFDSNPSQLNDLDFLRQSIAESEVAIQLKQLGYTYLHVLSGMLLPSSIADINRDYTPAGPIDIKVDDSDFDAAVLFHEKVGVSRMLDRGFLYKQSFLSLYHDTTLLRIVKSQLDKIFYTDEFMPHHVYAAERFLDTLADVETFPSMPEAIFAIVHLMKPHAPIVFTENGDKIRAITFPSPAEHLDELKYVNSRLLQTIDTILDNSQNEPVIILQADHGSTHGHPSTQNDRLTHFDSYAAYYLPDGFTLDIPQPYTFINSFPLILNEIFAADYELKDDRLMELLRGYGAPFEQADVTDEFLLK